MAMGIYCTQVPQVYILCRYKRYIYCMHKERRTLLLYSSATTSSSSPSSHLVVIVNIQLLKTGTSFRLFYLFFYYSASISTRKIKINFKRLFIFTSTDYCPTVQYVFLSPSRRDAADFVCSMLIFLFFYSLLLLLSLAEETGNLANVCGAGCVLLLHTYVYYV